MKRFYDESYAAYEHAMYYALPGACASRPFANKTDECRAAEPGGECAHLREVDGDADCTWHAEPLGHVTLEELMGTDAIVGHKHYAHLNSREYRSCFWDEKGSKERARQRVAELDRRFREKYPGVPGDIPPPEWGKPIKVRLKKKGHGFLLVFLSRFPLRLKSAQDSKLFSKNWC